MFKTKFNRIFDVERRRREIKTLHALNKIPTRDAKLILNDLETAYAQLLAQLPEEQREFFLRNRAIN